MPFRLDALPELAASAARSAARAGETAGLSAEQLTTAIRLWGAVREIAASSLAVLAADAERRSARQLGAAGLAQRHGAKGAAELVQQLTGSAIDDARRLVRVGGLLEEAQATAPGIEAEAAADDVPSEPSLDALRALGGAWEAPTGVALRNGWLSAAQGDAIRTGLGVPRDGDGGEWRAAVLELIARAWEAGATVEDLGKAARAHRASLDRRWAQREAERLHQQRSLTRRVRGDGMVKYDLLLDPESDERMWGPIARRMSPRLGGPRFLTDEELARARELEADSRSNEQLLADELLSILGAGLDAVADGGALGQVVPQLNIAVTSGELRKARDAQSALARHHAGDHAECPGGGRNPEGHRDCPGPDVGIAWLEGSGRPVTALTALRALCEGSIAGLLFDESGRAIDVTKSERLFSARQRRAMALRDGGCLWPGCGRPPSECEAHHLNPWSEDSRNHTSETRDGVLLCRFHHLSLHNHGGRISREGSVYRLHWPGAVPVRLAGSSSVMVQLAHDGHLAR